MLISHSNVAAYGIILDWILFLHYSLLIYEKRGVSSLLDICTFCLFSHLREGQCVSEARLLIHHKMNKWMSAFSFTFINSGSVQLEHTRRNIYKPTMSRLMSV